MSGYPLRFQIGARTLLSITRRLVRTPFSLKQVLEAVPMMLPPLGRGAHGHILTSLPEALLPSVLGQARGLHPLIRQRYTRRFADLRLGFDAYIGAFSSKARSTLLRKQRRFAERSGGTIDVRCFDKPDDVDAFVRLAGMVSAKTYQERLLDAGLPMGEADVARMRLLAGEGRMRGYVLMLNGVPVSYLYLPAAGRTLIYAYLGYDPAVSDLSPGSVLQVEAMRLLMAEGAFDLLDFTEGEGQHKRQFATGGVPCLDLLLLRPTIGNHMVMNALALFDSAVDAAKVFADRPALRLIARAIRR